MIIYARVNNLSTLPGLSRQADPHRGGTLGSAAYLLLRCRAEQLAIRDNSVDLVIATPPYYGEPRVPRMDCCPGNSWVYGAFLARCLSEASRIVRPGGYILVHIGKLPLNLSGTLPFLFHVLNKSARGSPRTVTWIGTEEFHARFVAINGINWYALPMWLYRAIISRYSRPGAIVVHTFSGTGNSAIAALRLSRFPILVDLHHHRQVESRLKKVRLKATAPISSR